MSNLTLKSPAMARMSGAVGFIGLLFGLGAAAVDRSVGQHRGGSGKGEGAQPGCQAVS